MCHYLIYATKGAKFPIFAILVPYTGKIQANYLISGSVINISVLLHFLSLF